MSAPIIMACTNAPSPIFQYPSSYAAGEQAVAAGVPRYSYRYSRLCSVAEAERCFGPRDAQATATAFPPAAHSGMHGPPHQASQPTAMHRRVSGSTLPGMSNAAGMSNTAGMASTAGNVAGLQPQGMDFNGFMTAAAPQQPQQQQAQSDAADLERHQRSANGPTADDPYYHLRLLQQFPVPGSRPARRTALDDPSTAATAAQYLPQAQPQPPIAPEPTQPPKSSQNSTSGVTPMVRRASVRPDDDDPVKPFIDGLAHAAENPQRAAMWTELIRLKTRALELQIAEARAKERAAELQLTRLQQGTGVNTKAGSTKSGSSPAITSILSPGPSSLSRPTYTSGFSSFPTVGHEGGSSFDGLHNLLPPPAVTNVDNTDASSLISRQQSISQTPLQTAQSLPYSQQQTHMTPFDLEAMLRENNLDNLFSWLPDTTDGAASSLLPQSAAPADLVMGGGQPEMMLPNMSMATAGPSHTSTATGGTPATPQSPGVKRQRSPSAEASPPAPAAKKGKARGEKKVVVEQHAACTACGRAVARVLIRAPKSTIPSPTAVEFRCPSCAGSRAPPSFDTVGGGPNIGSTEARKRMRTAMEDDDMINAEPQNRRCFCDVCQRFVAIGQVIGGPERAPLGHISEIVCAACDSKYQRCTDCGGGGGPRVGIGKWRLKQVFQPGRKTCSLSHSRLGDRPREIGVHVTPTDFTPEQLKEVISRCKTLWTEKTLSRLAVPEMLEIDLPPNIVNPLRNFADVEDLITRCWPSREAMIRAEGVDRNRFKRLLGLTWAHSRPRRSVRTVDLEEEYARHEQPGDDDDMSTVLANVKRTNVVIPPGSELIGMWGGEWDMQHGSLLVSTLIPFEGTDGEDSTALSVGELITKVQQLLTQMNGERTAAAEAAGTEPDLVRPCEHLWVVSGGSMPLIRERMADILVRKRSFVHVEEYLTRHPDFLHALKARPVGLHPDQHRPLPHQISGEYEPPQPLVLVRWLGKDFDAQRILEIKQMEFGGGKAKKLKKMPKSKV